MNTLYGNHLSANCYKVSLLLHQLEVPFRYVDIDIFAGPRPDDFVAKNPAGKVPFVELEDGSGLSESDAILFFFAQGTPLWPGDVRKQTEVLRWMFFEQNEHEPNIAVSRAWIKLLGWEKTKAEILADKHQRGVRTLEAMERHLGDHEFFANDRYSIADIALYGYTHVAPEGGFDLAPYGAIQSWMDRVVAQPGHVTMKDAF